MVCIGRKRMHLIALAFAHLDGETPPWSQSTNGGHLLFRGSAAELLDMTLGRQPRGLKRTLDRMPPRVLQPESYRRLLDLLEEPAAAKALSHADSINDSSLKALADTPVTLRPTVFAIDSSHLLDGLADGLRFLVARGAAPSFEALIADLKSLRQPAQLIARLKRIVETLPFPEPMPPAHVGHARRLDDPNQIRELAKLWRNCLENYLFEIDQGTCAVYFWDDAATPAASLIRRRGRLGWFLEESKGPWNDELKPERLEEICRTFAAVDIPESSIITAIENIIAFERTTRRRRHQVRLQPNDTMDEELSFDLDAA
jgi:hypothetical protein